MSVTCGRSVVLSRYSGFTNNKTDCHNITEILLKVALNTITLTPVYFIVKFLPNNYGKTSSFGVLANMLSSSVVYHGFDALAPQVWYIMGLMPWLFKCGISWIWSGQTKDYKLVLAASSLSCNIERDWLIVLILLI